MDDVRTMVLVVPIGLIPSSAFTAIVVFAQDLVPGKVGLVSGLFFGLAFGFGGLGAAGAAGLGVLADARGIHFVYRLCAFLPAIGLLTAVLPDTRVRVAELGRNELACDPVAVRIAPLPDL